MEIAISILTIIFGVISATLPSFKKVKYVKDGRTRLTTSGKWVVTLVCCVVCLQIAQIVISEKSKVVAQKEINRRDSLNKDFIIKNNSAITTPFAQGLAKYGLKFNQATKQIEKLIRLDTNKKTIVLNDIKPDLIISDALHSGKDTIKLVYSMLAKSASVFNAKIKNYCVLRDGSEKLIFEPSTDIFSIRKLTPESGMERTIRYVATGRPELQKIYLYATGTYEDGNGKEYKLKELVYYDFKLQGIGYLTEKEFIWVHDFIERSIPK